MKLGFNQATCMKNSNLYNDLLLAEKYGYDFIEIRIDMLRDYLEEYSIADLKKFFSKSHLQPIGYNSIEDINFCDKNSWQVIHNDIAFACQVSQEIGGEFIVIVPTIQDGVLWNSEEVFEDSVKVLNKVADQVAPYGLKVAFEPIGSQKCCVRSLDEAYAIVEAVNKKNVGLVIDAFNLYLYDQWKDIDVLDKIPLEKIFIYHIDDADDLPIEILDHCHRLFPGNGVIDLGKISKALKDRGFAGVCSLELFNPGYWMLSPEHVFQIGAKKSRKYL